MCIETCDGAEGEDLHKCWKGLHDGCKCDLHGRLSLDSDGKSQLTGEFGFQVDPETMVKFGKWVDNPNAKHFMEKQKWKVSKVTWREFMKEFEKLLIEGKEAIILHERYKKITKVIHLYKF